MKNTLLEFELLCIKEEIIKKLITAHVGRKGLIFAQGNKRKGGWGIV